MLKTVVPCIIFLWNMLLFYFLLKKCIWNRNCSILNVFTVAFDPYIYIYIYIYIRAVTILDFSYHSYCGHEDSWYRYIAISIETLGEGEISVISFTLFTLSFSFSPNEYKDTDKPRAQDCLLRSSYEITREKILSSSTVWWININGNTLQ